jgi:hypothetical protein
VKQVIQQLVFPHRSRDTKRLHFQLKQFNLKWCRCFCIFQNKLSYLSTKLFAKLKERLS